MDITELLHIPENTRFFEIYDDYVDYYNKAGDNKSDHISILAEFAIIEEKIQKSADFSSNKLSDVVLDWRAECMDLFRRYNQSNRQRAEMISELMREIESKIGSLRKYLINMDLKPELNKIATNFDNLLKEMDGFENDQKRLYAVKNFCDKICRYYLYENHKFAFEEIIAKILDKNYPSELKYFWNRDSRENNQINFEAVNGLGAPMREDVPQDKIESIVIRILLNNKKGQTIKADCRGETRSFSIVHRGGSRDGKANINQIYKYFEAAHPELINLSSRQFKERIKLAVPDKMK